MEHKRATYSIGSLENCASTGPTFEQSFQNIPKLYMQIAAESAPGAALHLWYESCNTQVMIKELKDLKKPNNMAWQLEQMCFYLRLAFVNNFG